MSAKPRGLLAGWLVGVLTAVLVFVLLEPLKPTFSTLGERIRDRILPPPGADLRMQVLRQEDGALLVYVTNLGGQHSVVERLDVCPPNKGYISNRYSDELIKLWDPLLSATDEAMRQQIVLHDLYRGPSDEWAAGCHRDGSFIPLRVVAGDRRVPPNESTELAFQAPDGFYLYSDAEHGAIGVGTQCTVQLLANNDYIGMVFPCRETAEGLSPGATTEARQ
jgi:hypothetical protein